MAVLFMKKTKVLFVFNDLKGAGIERVLELLSKEFSKMKKYEIYLALFNNIQNIPFYGEIIDLKAPTTKNYFLLLINIAKRVIRLNKIVKEKEIDVIISCWIIPNLIALLSKKIYKFKTTLIVSYHGNLKQSSKYMGISGLIAKRYNIKFNDIADRIVSVSKGTESELYDNGFNKDKLVTIYNPVSINEIDAMSKQKINREYEFIFDKNYKIIISVGRLIILKNIPLLIESYMEVNKKIKSRLIIVGDGPERSKLEKLIIDNNQQENIYLLGWQNNPFNYLKRSDLFVLTSNSEGFGNVIIESMACGTPVISTDCQFGPNEIIQNNINGILVPVNDKLKLSEAMSKVLSDEFFAMKLSSQGKQRALDFSSDKIAMQYEKLIDEVL